MANVVLKTAWMRNDPQLQADAIAFWEKNNLVPSPEERQRRAGELVVVTYVDGEPAAVATAELAVLPNLRARFAMCRTAVAPHHRRSKLSAHTFAHVMTALEAWSADNPEEKVMGMAAVIQATEYAEKQREPIWYDFGLLLAVAGFTPRGEQIRVGWFRHARFDP